LCILRKTVRKHRVLLKSVKNNGTLHEDHYKFLVISRSILLRMRSVSDKICTGNQNTHFVFSNVFPKIMSLMRYCGKLMYSAAHHRQQYGACALHATNTCTLIIYNTLCFSITPMISSKRVSVSFYI